MLANLNASRFIKGAALVVLALAGVALLLWSGLARSAPSVRWTPGTVYEEINPGVPRTVTLTFIAQDAVPATTVRVVPEIQPYASVTPATIGALQKGQKVQVTLTLQAAPNVTLFTAKNGTIQLRQQSAPNKTIAQPISVSLLVVPVGFPPDPGEAGKATVEGIDSNNNGVRDDVERWIARTYPNSTKLRAALAQHAKASKQMLLAGEANNENQMRASMDSIQTAQLCLRYVIPGIEREGPRRLLEAAFLNTEARTTAYLNFNTYWERRPLVVKTAVDRSACEFDPDALGS